MDFVNHVALWAMVKVSEIEKYVLYEHKVAYKMVLRNLKKQDMRFGYKRKLKNEVTNNENDMKNKETYKQARSKNLCKFVKIYKI